MKISRRESRKSERRAVILDVARQSFFGNGYAATTMSEIAAKLGGSKGTLWNYFPSKEDLFAAVLDEAITEFKQRLSASLELHEDVRTTLTGLCRHMVATITSPTVICLHRLINGESGRFPEIGKILYERGPKNVKAIIAGYLDRCIEGGFIRPCDTFVAAGHLTALCTADLHQKLLLHIIENASPQEIEAEAGNAADVFLRAYWTGKEGAPSVTE